MKQQLHAIQAEFIKLNHSKVLWTTFIAFSIVPIMGGIFILFIRDSNAMEMSSSLAYKVKAMNLKANWDSYFITLSQGVGIGGIIIFGFVASYIFGREYSDGTAKDLLSLPTSRTKILNAKFFVFIIWCFGLVLSNLLIASIIGSFLNLPLADAATIIQSLILYLNTTVLTIIIGIPIALFALIGKGYLAPLGFLVLALVFAQIIAAAGYGTYFPWAVPGLYSGAGGEYKELLNTYSYLILFLTGIAGYIATVMYWKKTDQT